MEGGGSETPLDGGAGFLRDRWQAVTRAGLMALRRPAIRAFFGHRFLREMLAAARWSKRRSDAPDLAHLAFYEETVLGPVQRDEALLLHSLVRLVRPQTIVEIGFLRGHSAFNFLRALDAEGRLYSFDIDPACADVARERFGSDPRFVFQIRSQTALTLQDIDGHLADLVFIDASHDLALNQETFERLIPLLAPNAIVAIHDTGTVPRTLFPPWHWLLDTREGWVGDEYEGQPDERAFVNWLLEYHSEFSQVHLHSRRTIRCGLTFLQRSAPLARPAAG